MDHPAVGELAKGLFGRGLGTRLLTNAVQASLFTVVWKYLEMNMNA